MNSWKFAGLFILVAVVLGITGKVVGVFDKVTNSTHIISSYEEYEDMYAACEKISQDICVLEKSDVSETAGFNKSERLLSYENKMNRWINEYNSKSRQIHKNLWKSSDLPHKLIRSDFTCN